MCFVSLRRKREGFTSNTCYARWNSTTNNLGLGDYDHLRNRLKKHVGLFLFLGAKNYIILGFNKMLNKYDMYMQNEDGDV